MKENSVLVQARRLHALGLAIIWLHPKSKRPVGDGWTTGPKKEWHELKREYREGYNVGVRLGAPSKLPSGFLAVIDVDIKGEDARFRRECLEAARSLTNLKVLPMVLSGRGGGSRHYYYCSEHPFKTWNPFGSTEYVKYFSPDKTVSKRDRAELTEAEIKKGWRIGRAWEVSLYSDGRQVVLPPSIHPDSGEAYQWKRPIEETSQIPLVSIRTALPSVSEKQTPAVLEDFKVSPVELSWLPISSTVREGISSGKGVSDRSGFLMKASSALLSAGLNQNEVLTILTDPETFIGGVGYEHAKTESRKRAAEWVYRYTFKKVASERGNAKGVFIHAKEARDLSKEEQAKQAEEIESERHWTEGIAKNRQGHPFCTVQNVVHIISHRLSPEIVRRDEFAYRDTYSANTEWGGKKNALVTDDDVAAIKYWLGVNYAFEPSNNTISDALIVIARRNCYDPVKQLLDGLPEWDGVERLNTWLSENFEATGDPEYLAQVFRKWMVAMVMRAYCPGSKFDWMPIFEGAQGIGKSSFGRLLVGDRYFLDWLPNLNDKDAQLSLQGMWGVELGELSQFRRNELESIKAFVTRTVDKMRPPYGRRVIESPRRCVFFGTTNRQTYLIDETGNRRFKPVVVGSLNFKALKKDRLQLFAEARHLFKEKIETEQSLELDGQARIYERVIHHEKMVEDDSHSMEESMRNFIEKVGEKEVNFNLQKFKILDLFEGAGPLGGWRKENKNLQFAAKMLKRLGGESRRIKGLRHWKLGVKSSGVAGFRVPPTPPKEGLKYDGIEDF